MEWKGFSWRLLEKRSRPWKFTTYCTGSNDSENEGGLLAPRNMLYIESIHNERRSSCL